MAGCRLGSSNLIRAMAEGGFGYGAFTPRWLLENHRLDSFKDWPFQEDCLCTPQKLAEAGFLYVGTDKEPDLVKCVVCGKQLGEWDPEDDPWEEHKTHAPQCPLIKLGKKEEDLTVADFYNLCSAAAVTCVKADMSAQKEKFLSSCAEVRDAMKNQCAPNKKGSRIGKK